VQVHINMCLIPNDYRIYRVIQEKSKYFWRWYYRSLWESASSYQHVSNSEWLSRWTAFWISRLNYVKLYIKFNLYVAIRSNTTLFTLPLLQCVFIF
jgi:hypothetical protein